MSAAPGIVTPEAVVLDVERAGVASRVLAITIDVFALVAAWTALFLAALAILGEFEGTVGAIIWIFFSLGFYLAWFAGFETLLQRTPGKAALGLRVVSTDGTPVRFQQAFLRAVIGIIDFFLLPFGFVAVVTTLLSPQDQRLGDLAAGTLVVRQRSAGSLVAPARFHPPQGYEAYVSSLDVTPMTEDQYGLVRRFLLRSHQLTPAARIHLAIRLANPLSLVLRHAPPSYLHPEFFLLCVASAWQAAHGVQQDVWWQPPPPPRPPPPVAAPAAPRPPPPPPPPHW